MKRAIYPGSFDPLTLGHLDMIERSAKIVDELVIGVLNNSAKNSLFSLDERVSMIKEMTESMPNVTVASFDGLLVDYMKEINATIIVRGLRAVTDFEYELQIAQTNHVENPEVETIFLTTSLQYSYLSSTIVKEFASYGGDISKFVPEGIEGMVPYKGPVGAIIYQLMGGLHSSMGYCGCPTIDDMRHKAAFVEITAAGMRESHVHDVQITKEAPNYHQQ